MLCPPDYEANYLKTHNAARPQILDSEKPG